MKKEACNVAVIQREQKRKRDIEEAKKQQYLNEVEK